MDVKNLLKQMLSYSALHRQLLLLPVLLLLITCNVFGQTSSSTSNTSVATVATDKDDYAPGEYVIITGSGWEPGERVNFTFEETPKPETCVNSHDNHAIADANGNIYYDGFLIKINHLGVHFVLTATGLSSGRVAKTEFTDANVNFTTSGLPSNVDVTVTYSGSATGSITFSTGNNGNAKSSNIPLSGNLTFSYPANIISGGVTYALSSTTPNSPTTVPLTGNYPISGTYTTCTVPATPIVGTITQPTCATATASVALSGLPTSSWTVTASPGGATLTGSTATATFTGLAANTTYTFTVTSGGCTSPASGNAVINAQPATPSITVNASATGVLYSKSSQTTSLGYSNALQNPTIYSITWDASPANSFATVTDAVLGESPITILVPAGTSVNTYTGHIIVKNANCTSSSSTFTITVNKATPVITWANPADITYGTALSATQLNATSGGVAGTFTYTRQQTPY
jgi:hypothetical protein